LRPAHGGHGAESLGGQQDPVSDSGVHRVERHHGVAAIRAVQIQWLHQQQLAAFMAGVLLSGHQLAHHAGNQHGLTFPRFGVAAARPERESALGVAGLGAAAGFTCTESTIPTIVVSVGGSAGRKGKLASLPRTQ